MRHAIRYVVGLAALLCALPACQCQGNPPSSMGAQGSRAASSRQGQGEGENQPAGPAAPLRAETSKLDLGSSPIHNPLNVYDIGIAGSPDWETAGTVDDVRITMQDLEAQSVGAFSRIAERIYQAEEQGYAWLIERVALSKQAARAGAPLIPFLLGEYTKLPQPTQAQRDAILAQAALVPMSDEERTHAATSLWRLAAWQERRHELVLAGRAGTPFERIRRQISAPEYARSDTVVAQLDGKPITRAELRWLAGYQAELARHEYWRIARMQFERYVSRFLVEREAQHLGITVEELKQREAERMPPISDADVRAFIADNPEYGREADGRARARDNLRRLRTVEAEEALDKRLRSTAVIRFVLEEPVFERFPIEVPAPRWHGPAEAQDVLVAFHGLGCETCTRGSELLRSVLAARPGKLKLLAGDYFVAGQLGSYRGALALHCAPPDRRDALLEALVRDFGSGEIGSLTGKAEAVGIEPERFRGCMVRDQLLPLIAENLAMAERLGLERNVPGLFVNGVRIGDLKDLDKVLQQIDSALKLAQP